MSATRHRSFLSRRAAGRIMIGVAVVGFVTSIVGVVVAWQLLGTVTTANERGLRIGEEALATLDSSLTVADDVVTAVDDGLATVGATVRTVERSIGSTTAIASSTADLAASLPDSLARIDDALGTLEGVTGTIDGTLRQLSRIPFGPDYDPETGLDQAVGNLRDDIAPISENLRAVADELEGFAGGGDDLEGELSGVAGDIDGVRTALSGSAEVLDRARATAAEASALARSTRADLGDQLGRSRVLAVLLGLVIAVGQIVPYWVGRELLAEDAEADLVRPVTDPEPQIDLEEA